MGRWGTPAWGEGPEEWGDLERDVSLAVCGPCVPCPYNQPLHSLSLAHGVMNPQVPTLHQRLPCPDSLPVPALPAPPVQPSLPCLWVPGWAQARGHCQGKGDAVFRGMSKLQDPQQCYTA